MTCSTHTTRPRGHGKKIISRTIQGERNVKKTGIRSLEMLQAVSKWEMWDTILVLPPPEQKEQMMYLDKFSRCFLLSFAVVLLLLKPSSAQVVCPDAYGGHLQGIAIDDNNSIYWPFTVTLVKTDETGNILAKVDVPSHHGDLTTKDGKVYVAVNLGNFNQEPGHAKSWIYVYDAKDLKLISKHSVPEVVHGAGGIGHHKGHFFVVGGLPKGYKENYVYEYDKNFSFLKRHVIKSGYTSVGIQTVCFSQGCWWFGCYGSPPTLLKTDESFRMLGKYHFGCALGIDELPGDRFLIGRDKAKNEKGRRGQVLIAKMDCDNGLIIVDENLKQIAPANANKP